MKFDKKVSDFLKEKPDLTVLGLYWAGLWRFLAVYAGVVLVIAIIAKLFE